MPIVCSIRKCPWSRTQSSASGLKWLELKTRAHYFGTTHHCVRHPVYDDDGIDGRVTSCVVFQDEVRGVRGVVDGITVFISYSVIMRTR